MPYTGYNSVTASATNGVIWTSWVSNTTSATSVTLTTQNVWRAWNGTSSGTTVTNATDTIWGNWNAVYYPQASPQAYTRMPETPEQRASREASLARYQAEEARRREEQEAANRRAEALLRAHITPEQQEQLERDDWFLIDTASGKKYRINRGRSANIDVLDENGKAVRSLCVHPREGVPDADTMLSQALMLKYDEETLLRMANVHPVNHGFRRRPIAA